MAEKTHNQVASPGSESERQKALQHRLVLAISTGLFLAVLVVFWLTLRNGFVNLDDYEIIYASPEVTSGFHLDGIKNAFTGTFIGNWDPLTMLSHMLDCQIYKLDPAGHHLTNVLLHGAVTVLLFLAFWRMSGAIWCSASVAALFALHPLRVESVAWIAERKDVLSTFFWMLTLLMYACYADRRRPARAQSGGAPPPSSRAWVYYTLALISFALGLLSKPMLVTLPFTLLLLDYWPLRRLEFTNRGSSVRDIGRLTFEKLPFFLLAAAMSIITFLVQKKMGAMDVLRSVPLGYRLENGLVSYCRYLGKLVVPTNLSVVYPYPDHWPIAVVLLAAGFLAIVTTLALYHGRKHPYLPVGWFWYLGTLIPVIGIVQVGPQAMADRYTYVPTIGILAICAWGLVDLTTGLSQQRRVLAGAATAALLVFASLTVRQIGFWKDSESLCRHALACTEKNTIAHLNLGVALLEKGFLNEARSELQESLKCSPNNSRAHMNLASAAKSEGRTAEEIAEYQAAIRIEPKTVVPRYDLAMALASQGQLDQAIAEIHRELPLMHDTTNGRLFLASILRKQGKLPEALEEYSAVLKLAPNDFSAHNNFGIALYQSGRIDDAVTQFREAVRLKPTAPAGHANLALALTTQGGIDEAIAEYREVLKLQPDSVLARQKLEALLQRK